jgi:hypothetical protein
MNKSSQNAGKDGAMMDGGGEYHLNNDETEKQQPNANSISSSRESLLSSFHINKKNVVRAVAVLLILVVTSMAAVANRRISNSRARQCPSFVDRWVYYNGAYFSYSFYLQQYPNPDPKILILHGGVYVVPDDVTDDVLMDPNNFSHGEGCGGGGWSVTYGNADGSSFTLEYSLPTNDDTLRQQGGTFSIGGVEYDLQNNGSVFLIYNNEAGVTQLSGLDVSSLVIDKKTMSVSSVTAFCNANQDILDFFDTALANYNNNNNNADGDGA